MPKMVKIPDPLIGEDYIPLPLRLTFRNRRQRSKHTSVGNRLRVKCGCCDEVLEMRVADDYENKFAPQEMIEINGVMATIAQWREVLLPVLGIKVPRDPKLEISRDSLICRFNTFQIPEGDGSG